MMPQLLTVRVHEHRKRPFRIWIPVLPVLLLLSPFLILAVLILALLGLAYGRNPIRAFTGTWGLVTGLQGLEVDIVEARTAVRISFN
jgi:hypothetical protein